MGRDWQIAEAFALIVEQTMGLETYIDAPEGEMVQVRCHFHEQLPNGKEQRLGTWVFAFDEGQCQCFSIEQDNHFPPHILSEFDECIKKAGAAS